MKLKIVDIGLALGAGLLVVFGFRLIENVSGMYRQRSCSGRS